MSSQMHSVNKSAGIEKSALETAIASATRALLGYRKPDGHWVFELEADSTIPAEYVLLRHYLGEPVDGVLEAKIANYLRRVQGIHGGWPLVHDGDFDMSASVKAYFALKMIGDSVDAPHMARAREVIRSRGGAIHSNVVAVPYQQDFILGADHDRAVDGSGGAEAAGEKCQRSQYR
jgi:squalene-hopene/tetraprenyl-beta-curcumene cyclase